MLGPALDQVEISLFGPGYGECAVIHLGNGNWLVIDSCIDSSSGEPAALAYFDSIDVRPAEAVRLVIASHWHDDHIRGLGKVLTACRDARFCCAAALTQKEFLACVFDYSSLHSTVSSSGMNEILQVFKSLDNRTPPYCTPLWANPNRKIFQLPSQQSGHGLECSVTSLSPSDKQYQKFLIEIAALIPRHLETKLRAVAQRPNHVAVVTWVQVGDVSILFGSDLEDSPDLELGWSTIVASRERPNGRASVFKVPHHGSKTGHNAEVWQGMVVEQVHAILSPCVRGRTRLPSVEDIRRVSEQTDRAYITSSPSTSASKKRRPYAVVKTIRETVGSVRAAQPPMGWVRLRNGGAQHPDAWTVHLSEEARPLAELIRPAT